MKPDEFYLLSFYSTEEQNGPVVVILNMEEYCIGDSDETVDLVQYFSEKTEDDDTLLGDSNNNLFLSFLKKSLRPNALV